MQWIGLLAVSLPGLAALGALLFTWMQVSQASKELRISEQGHITNRFNAAIGNMGSKSVDVRLGGIYSLQRIMEDSPRDHATIVSVLAAYVREHAPRSAGALQDDPTEPPPTDIQAAMTVLANRRPDKAGVKASFVDLSRTTLPALKPLHTRDSDINLRGVVFTEAELTEAPFDQADMEGSLLNGANLTYAGFIDSDLRGASFQDANLTNASFCGMKGAGRRPVCAKLTNTVLYGANLTNGDLSPADLRGALICTDWKVGRGRPPVSGDGKECANLTGADLTHANLQKARLSAPPNYGPPVGADLTRADLTSANLTGADLTNANLTGAVLKNTSAIGANLMSADLSGADLTGANLTGADLRNTNLTNANLRNTNVTGANMDGANTKGANLHEVRGLPSSLR
ncbi:pentapeptide repeat-containing protein [Streptomyces lavendulocolor]|uniref:pentapeptide repeat-containing protein n=1 Tax=Streptomyces lavendulocolor TaxID=67316 RepID=UPI003C2B37A2